MLNVSSDKGSRAMRLLTRQHDEECTTGYVWLGGIKIAGGPEREVAAAISSLQEKTMMELRRARWTMRTYLRNALKDEIDADNPDRLFSAIFGRMLAVGDVASEVCLSSKDNYY